MRSSRRSVRQKFIKDRSSQTFINSFLSFSFYVAADLTDYMFSSFQLIGASKAVANTSIGEITLDPIEVNATTGLWGLKGLNNGLTIIRSVDVMGGTPDAITLNIDSGIYNPSSLELATGDLTLQLFREGVV